MEITLIFPRCAGRKGFVSDHLKKIKKWSVSKNQLLTYDVAESVEDSLTASSSTFSSFDASSVPFLIAIDSDEY